ncbi:MAG: 50S ribosomal protein L4 [Elusimicrobia bacterium]|nr:50S ribosomal protein L4 [Elusimicrobiota bacterium]MDE2237000.1 50S ribosomal protein L4 [Elusimicrobiota bacterium]MDE2425311.1 50S ribosomal protein L4 [Elusimicrobiota bacterium]
MEAELLNAKGEAVGKVELKESVFGKKPSGQFLHEYVTIYLANQRQYDAKVKTRTEVSGGGHKPWKQKHTGRARAGSIRSPLWRKGGVIHGPKNVEREFSMPRRKARLALAQALAAKNAERALVFVDQLKIAEAKTKQVAHILRALGCEGRTILVLDQPDAALTLAARNIPQLEVLLAGDLNAYVVLRSKKIILTRPALEKLGARWN